MRMTSRRIGPFPLPGGVMVSRLLVILLLSPRVIVLPMSRLYEVLLFSFGIIVLLLCRHWRSGEWKVEEWENNLFNPAFSIRVALFRSFTEFLLFGSDLFSDSRLCQATIFRMKLRFLFLYCNYSRRTDSISIQGWDIFCDCHCCETS